MSNPAVKLLTLLLLLQKKSNRKVAELAEELEVSPRTVHRYLGMLEDMGIPLYSERGRYGGFSLVQGYELPPLMFSADEAAVLYLGAAMVNEMWPGIYGDNTQSVIAKLENVLPADLQAEASRVNEIFSAGHLYRYDIKEMAPLIKTLGKQIKNKKSSRILYKSSQESETTRIVDFYALVHRFGWSYAIGYCHLRKEIRSFRVDRIAEFETLENNFETDTDFDLNKYLNDSQWA